MANGSNYNEKDVKWVQPTTPSSMPPSQKTPLPQAARIVIFGLITIVGIGLIVLFTTSFFNRQQERSSEQMQTAVQEAIIECRTKQDPDRCIANLASQLAKENGNVEFCTMLETEDMDSCFFLAAQGAENRALCSRIVSEDQRFRCEDALFGGIVTYEQCAGYHDMDAQTRCEQNWVRNQWQSGDCSSTYVDDELCDEVDKLQAAIDAQDPDLCEEIQNQVTYDSCQEFVQNGDRDFDGVPGDEEERLGLSDNNPDFDGDGLTDGAEIYEHGTDPTLVDSDADGFDDKTEIDNGFNPLS